MPRNGPQRIGSSNCLAKTQVYAKPKGEVYGLTLALKQMAPGSAQIAIVTPLLLSKTAP